MEKFRFPEGQEEGRRSQLTCVVTAGDLPLTVSWLKDGHQLAPDPDIVVKQISEYSSVLLFQTLAERHSGAYTCVAANAAAATNHTAALAVKVSPRWTRQPQGAEGLVGEALSLHCGARGVPSPSITWSKAAGAEPRNFQPLQLPSLLRSQHEGAPRVFQNGTLHFPSARPADAGWYLCQADNGVLTPIASYVRLDVHAGAKVVSPGGRVTGLSGQLVTLTCEAVGDPPLTVRWAKGDQLLPSGGRFSVEETPTPSGGWSAVLRVSGVSPPDGGEYACTASNHHGSQTVPYTVAVLEPPRPPSDVRVADVTSHSATVAWTLAQPATVWLQYTARDGGASHNVTAGPWSRQAQLTQLAPDARYCVSARAANELGASGPAPPVCFSTLQEAPRGAPRDLSVTPWGPGALSLKWRGPDPRLDPVPLRGYLISLRLQQPPTRTIGVVRPVGGDEAGGQEQYVVRGLEPGALYEAAVHAFNRAGLGPPSSPRVVRATLFDAPQCPPTALTCRGMGPDSIRVSWAPPSVQCSSSPSPITGYVVSAIPTSYVNGVNKGVEATTNNLEKGVSGLPPAANVSVRVAAVSRAGRGPPSAPYFCAPLPAVPSAPTALRGVSTGVSSILVSWGPPLSPGGTLLHYTLYTLAGGKPVQRSLTAAAGVDAGWRELTGLLTLTPVQVWVSASTSAGEGPPSPRITLTPVHSPTHPPLILGGGGEWWVTKGGGLTLSCRRVGEPPPKVKWVRNGRGLAGGERLLPGGDIHLTDLKDSCNYTCTATSSEGEDHVVYSVHVTSPPGAPSVSVGQASHTSLNVTIRSGEDGGAPVLGYTVHHRLPAGAWEEQAAAVEVRAHDGGSSAELRWLPCGTAVHIYATAFNQYGVSPASDVIVGRTSGYPPPRPHPTAVVEFNASCVTLRLYAWPERGCPIQSWQVERQAEDAPSNEWQIIGSPITRDTRDIDLCDLPPQQQQLLKMSATSEAGTTTVLYRVVPAARTGEKGGSSGLVQEIPLSSSDSRASFLEVPVIAGCISALLLIAAIIICVCAAMSKRRFNFRTDSSGAEGRVSIDTKEKPMDGIYATGDSKRGFEFHNTDFDTSNKKMKRGSMASLSSRNDATSFEIYPYATLGSTAPRLSDDTQRPGAYTRCRTQAAGGEWHPSDEVYQSDDTDTYGPALPPTDRIPPRGGRGEEGSRPWKGLSSGRSIKSAAGPSSLRHQTPDDELSNYGDLHHQRSMKPLPPSAQQLQHHRQHQHELQQQYQHRHPLYQQHPLQQQPDHNCSPDKKVHHYKGTERLAMKDNSDRKVQSNKQQDF